MIKSRLKTSSNLEPVARASVSFPMEHYKELERIADDNKVSVAWVVRQAVEQYLVDRDSLFNGKDKA